MCIGCHGIPGYKTAFPSVYHVPKIAGQQPGYIVNAWSTSSIGDLVEGFEATGDRLVVGVQCHPERTESTPEAFERLFGVFVDACRGPARS